MIMAWTEMLSSRLDLLPGKDLMPNGRTGALAASKVGAGQKALTTLKH